MQASKDLLYASVAKSTAVAYLSKPDPSAPSGNRDMVESTAGFTKFQAGSRSARDQGYA